jgi:hypothetical protein
MGDFALTMLVGSGGLILIILVAKWLTPSLKPDEDEWEKYKDL